MTAPLYGTKTHPLKPASVAALRALAMAPKPRQEINPGVANRLEREALVDSVSLPSPYAAHKGRSIEHLKVSEAGLAVLRHMDGNSGLDTDEIAATEPALK